MQDETAGFVKAVEAARRAQRTPVDRSRRLGDVLSEVMRPLRRNADRTTRVQDAWFQVAPAGLAAHSRVCGVQAGRLRVQVDSSAYAYELRLCGRELVESMRALCPGMTIQTIQVSVGRAGPGRPQP
ncbi:MAG: DUF721 domain-containing protein [Phycisphaerae bacterium]|nr:DUF721 domain-containing protein [Phycisphaerae bacterium]